MVHGGFCTNKYHFIIISFYIDQGVVKGLIEGSLNRVLNLGNEYKLLLTYDNNQ